MCISGEARLLLDTVGLVVAADNYNGKIVAVAATNQLELFTKQIYCFLNCFCAHFAHAA
jgi:hypothetical protein